LDSKYTKQDDRIQAEVENAVILNLPAVGRRSEVSHFQWFPDSVISKKVKDLIFRVLHKPFVSDK